MTSLTPGTWDPYMPDTTEPQDWFFTFGSGHTWHGEPVSDFFVRINGTAMAARQQMVRVFGDRWSHQYSSEDAAGVQRFGLTELKVPSDAGTQVPDAPGTRFTVHVLHGGRALCGKPGVPGSWGPGHRWVRLDSDEGGPRSAANCPTCVAGLGVWVATPERLPEYVERACADRDPFTVARGLLQRWWLSEPPPIGSGALRDHTRIFLELTHPTITRTESGAPGHSLCDYEGCDHEPTVTLPAGAVMCEHHAAVALLASMTAEEARNTFRFARPVPEDPWWAEEEAHPNG